MISKLILTLTLLAPALSIIYGSPTVSTQNVPILKRHPGLYFPGENAVVDVELIYDPVCKDTSNKVALQKTSIKLSEKLSSNWDRPIQENLTIVLVFKLFPIIFLHLKLLRQSHMLQANKVRHRLWKSWDISWTHQAKNGDTILWKNCLFLASWAKLLVQLAN